MYKEEKSYLNERNRWRQLQRRRKKRKIWNTAVTFVDDETYEAVLCGYDADTDLAMLKVDTSALSESTYSQIHVVEIGDSDALEVGEQVVAIGNALGYGQSVTTGIVSAVNRSISEDTHSSSIFALAAAGFLVSFSKLKTEETIQADTTEITKNKAKLVYTEMYQDSVEEKIAEEKSSGIYTEDQMLIEENPYGTNTLSLYVYFTTEEPVSVSYNVSVPDSSVADFSQIPAGEDGFDTEHEFQVLGLIPEESNTITFTLTKEDGSVKTRTYVHEMGELSGEEELRLVQTKAAEEGERVTDGFYVILGNDSDEEDFMYYYDSSGILRGEIPLIGYRSHRLLFQDNLMYYSISDSKIAAVNALGKVEKIYDTGAYRLHHDYVFDDEGNLLVLATDTESASVEDQIIRINTQTGEISCVLDLEDLFSDYKETCTANEDGELDWMHINTIQWISDESILLSSRETSTILMIADIYGSPQVEYMIGEESFWQGTGYEELLLKKDESMGTFSNTGGQHSITYVEDESLNEGEYSLYLFDNNFGISESNPDYDWEQIDGIETSMKDGKTSYYYKYKVDENNGTYSLVQSFAVPYSAYVSSAQEYDGNIIIDSGMQGIFGEYDSNGNLIQEFQMTLADEYIYRVYKYDFRNFYFAG